MKLTLTAIGFVALASTAHAQFFLDQAKGVGLTNDDYTELKAASESLYQAPSPQVGDETIWRSEAGGGYGTAELEAYDGTCAIVKHAFRTARKGEVFRGREQRCKADDGRWLITPIEK
ncbi:MAG: hypothetical protein AAF501_18865 [Pseudomonadota bacterium]